MKGKKGKRKLLIKLATIDKKKMKKEASSSSSKVKASGAEEPNDLSDLEATVNRTESQSQPSSSTSNNNIHANGLEKPPVKSKAHIYQETDNDMFNVKTLEKGELVLAKFMKSPYWPSLVERVDLKKKSVFVWWIPVSHTTGKTRVNFKNIQRYTKMDGEISDKMLVKAYQEAEVLANKPRAGRLQLEGSPKKRGIFEIVEKSIKRQAVNAKKREKEDLREHEEILNQSQQSNSTNDDEPAQRGDLYSAVKCRKRRSQSPIAEEHVGGLGNKSSGITDTSPNCKTTSKTKQRKTSSLSPASSGAPTTKSAAVFDKGDIVWVKYFNWDWWPCIILNYVKQKKRVTFRFLPLDDGLSNLKGKRFSTSVKNVHRYKEHYYTHINQTRTLDKELCKAVEEADEIVSQKRNSFDSTSPPASTSPTSSAPEMEEVRVDEKEESEEGSEESEHNPPPLQIETDPDEDEDDPLPLPSPTPPRKEPRDMGGMELTDIIASDETKEHLRQIYKKEIANCRQEVWDAQPSMDPPVSLGPLKDEEKIEYLVEKLSLWFQEVNPDASTRNTFSYIICVWLPEAVKFSLMIKYECGSEDAENMLVNNVEEDANTTHHHSVTDPSPPGSPLPGPSGTAFQHLLAVACQEREKTTSPQVSIQELVSTPQ